MIETRFEIVNAIIHNPMEAVILFALVIFAWKYFGDGRRRHYIWRDFIRSCGDIKCASSKLNNNRYGSYCRLKVEYIEPVAKILKELKESENAYDKIFDVFRLPSPVVSQLMRALKDLELMDYDKEVGWVPTEKLLVTSGEDGMMF